MSAISPWHDPFRDESAIDNAISFIDGQSNFPRSEVLSMLKESARWSVSFVVGNDIMKKAFLKTVLQNKNESFLKDVAEEYQNRNEISTYAGKCGYSIGSKSYLEYIQSKVFGNAMPAVQGMAFSNAGYAELIRNALRSVADQLEYDLDDAIRQNDYITDETADELKAVVDDLNSCGISTGSVYGKIEKLAWFVGGDSHSISQLQQNLNKLGYALTEDGVFGSKTLDAVNDFYNELVRGSFPALAWVDPLQSNLTDIRVKQIGEYAALHDTSARSTKIKNGKKTGISVFRADKDSKIGYHINTISGTNIKNGDYLPLTELQQKVNGKLNHTLIDERTYNTLKKFDVHAKRIRIAGNVLLATGAVLDIIEILQTIHIDKHDADKKIGKTSNMKVATILGSWSMGALGAKGGAMLGATVGTTGLPGLGTAVGGVVGGLVLGIAGSYSGSKLGEYVVDITALE